MKESKTAILNTALSCFSQYGVEQTTIADIREQSGVSVGSIYHHFGSKDGIVNALFLSGLIDHNQRQELALKHCQNAEEGVKSIVHCYIDWICEHPDWARFIFRYRTMVEHSKRTDAEKQQRRAHYKHLKAWFGPYVDAGLMKALPFEVYHGLIIGPAQDFAQRWLAGRTQTDLHSHKDLFAHAAWQAVKN